jgi:type VI secretion system secreted protein VgrG
MAKIDITQNANRILLKAKEEILLVGGGSYLRINGATIENGTSGVWATRAAKHQFEAPAGMSASLPGLPALPEGQLKLEDLYANTQGLKGAPYKVVDVLGKTVEGTLDGSGTGLASGLAAGLARVFFEKDPRNPARDAEKFGIELPWPERMPAEIADLGQFSDALSLGPGSFDTGAGGNLPTQLQSLIDAAGNAASDLQDALPGMSSISGWGGEIPLPVLPEFPGDAVSGRTEAENTLNQLAGLAGAIPGISVPGIPTSAGMALPSLATPPFVPVLA